MGGEPPTLRVVLVRATEPTAFDFGHCRNNVSAAVTFSALAASLRGVPRSARSHGRHDLGHVRTDRRAADDPVRLALADPNVLTELLVHARAFIGLWLADRPIDEREEGAETAVQETARRALQKRAEFDPAVGSPAAWLHGFLVNVLKQTARALRRRPAQAPADPDDWDRITAALASTTDSEVDAPDLAGSWRV